MPSRTLFILLAFVCMRGNAWAQDSVSEHLVPIPAYRSDGYDQAVFKTLIVGGPGELWMVCKPSFSPEFALILHSELASPNTKNPYSPTEPRKWFLDTVTATKPIWHWKSNPDGSEVLDLLKDVPVERMRLEIDETLAKSLRRAWESVLRQTHYDKKESSVLTLDGTTYQFYCHYDLFGQTHSPRTGLPADLVSLSELLIKLVASPPESQPAFQKECSAAAQRLESAAKSEVEKAQP